MTHAVDQGQPTQMSWRTIRTVLIVIFATVALSIALLFASGGANVSGSVEKGFQVNFDQELEGHVREYLAAARIQAKRLSSKLGRLWGHVYASRKYPPVRTGEDTVVLTGFGKIRGLVEGGHRSFLGIPYAQPPIGPLRWRPPQPLPAGSLEGFNASSMGPSCIQLRSSPLSAIASALVSSPTGESEDCLRLNVFVPRTEGTNKPMDVLVFIHGGAFSTGSSSAPLYNPADLVETWRDVIVVTLDYRLGVFGYAASPALSEIDNEPIGNYGLLDQKAAIEWVKDNIAAFGGNPNSIAVMGHSAGSISASWLQILFPRLANRWILLSGNATNWHERRVDGQLETEEWRSIANAVGCTPSDISCMRTADPVKLNEAAEALKMDYLWGPTIDSRLIKKSARDYVQSGALSNHRDTLVTVVRDEGTIFVKEKLRSARDFEAMMKGLFSAPFVQTVISNYPINSFNSPFGAANAVISDAIFACPALSYYESLLDVKMGGKTHFAQFEHPLLVPSLASFFSEGRDYGVFHGSELVLLFNFAPIVTVPNVEQMEELRAGLRRFIASGSPVNDAPTKERHGCWWGPQVAPLRVSHCKNIWSQLNGHPAIPKNFRSGL